MMFRARTPRILLLNMSSTTSSSVVVVANVPFPMILRSSIPERGPKLTVSFFHYNISYLLIIPLGSPSFGIIDYLILFSLQRLRVPTDFCL